jgi:NTP pyrophosphatase (non-canonical NTP hydrolase)
LYVTVEKTMNVIEQITAEVARATVKFPTWPTDPLHALAVLGEEFGELTKAMLQHTYEPHKGVTQQDIREEAIQTAAMALRLAMSLDSYEYRRGEQHKQSSEGDRFIGRDVREIEALAAKGLREDGLPD